MRDEQEHRDTDLIDLGAATEVTQGDFFLTKVEQGLYIDHWDIT